MRRRQFLETTLQVASAALLTAYGRAQAEAPSSVEVATLDGGVRSVSHAALDELRGALNGSLLLPRDANYDAARRLVNSRFDKHPAFIVQPTGAADVALAVTFAHENSLLLAVKGGGHNEFGVSACDGGMMLDLSLLRGVQVDAGARRAWVQGATLSGLIDHETATRGLAVPLGGDSTVGIGGIALGGGIGKLSRRLGLTLDAIRSVDMVTADGRIRRASERENADLFWALRGGGGNFGVVTAFEFDLHPIPDQVFAGSISFPYEQARQVLSAYGEHSSMASDDLYIELFLAARADPKDAQLKLNVCFSGPAAEAERVLQPLRGFGRVIRDDVKSVSYAVAQGADAHAAAHAIAAGPAKDFYGRAGFLEGFGAPLAAAIAESLDAYPDRHVNMLFMQAGGAISQRPIDATAFSNRRASHDMAIASSWNSGEGSDRHSEHAHQAWAHLQPFTRGFYVNDMAGAVTPAEVSVNYGGNARRLAAVKKRWDPQNLFRLNANVLPGGAA